MRLISIAIAIPESCPPRGPGKIYSRSLPRTSCSAVKIATAGADNGTRCSLPAFIRSPGTVQTARAKSISGHVAPSLHPDLLRPLARLIAQASKRSQMILVSHALTLVSALDAEADSRQIVLEKQLGESLVRDGTPPDWTWPSR